MRRFLDEFRNLYTNAPAIDGDNHKTNYSIVGKFDEQ